MKTQKAILERLDKILGSDLNELEKNTSSFSEPMSKAEWMELKNKYHPLAHIVSDRGHLYAMVGKKTVGLWSPKFNGAPARGSIEKNV